jgi:hypothetical protein
MQFLIEFAAENREFLRLLERSLEFPTVQGVVLEIDRFWLGTWIERELPNGGSHDDYYFYERLVHYGGLDWRRSGGRPHFGNIVWPTPLTLTDVERWSPDVWKWWVDRRGSGGGKSPIVAKVCLRPSGNPEERIPTIAELAGDGMNLRVEIETRSRAQLSSNPQKAYSPVLGGVSVGVGPTDYGTLGVILKDARDRFFALTCAHVAPLGSELNQPAQRDLRSAGILGPSILATPLSASAPGMLCNPWSGATAHDIDASLIELSPTQATALLEVLDVGPLSGVLPRSSLSPLQTLEVMGRTSWFNTMQVGGLAAWYSFSHGGRDYCFKNLFEVESRYGAAGVIKLGDSGGPVCSPDSNGMAWAGLIAGRDAFKGYAMYSEPIEQWLSTNGYNLTVV